MWFFASVFKMRSRLNGIIVLVAFITVFWCGVCSGVGTGEIDAVRRKGVLSGGDLAIIDRFVAEGVEELVDTRDFASVGKLRQTILACAHSSTKSAEGQYSDQFLDSARKYIPAGFEAASSLEPEDRRFKAALNLLILVDELKDSRVAELAFGMLNDENNVIRYWAVHAVTNAAVAEQLNSRVDTRAAGEIVRRLKAVVERADARTTGLIADFAARINIPEGQELLLQIVDLRMSKYADWTVENELLDSTILKLLYEKMISQESMDPGVARRFGQLYSYAIQRYVKGRECIGQAGRYELASVLVEIEYECINSLLGGMRQREIKKAVELEDSMALLMEHNRLLGDDRKSGELPVKLDFDYGRDSAGNKLAGPLKLADPPEGLCSAKADSP